MKSSKHRKHQHDRHVIKEYHFYISDDRTHDTHYVQHYFHKFYDSLKERENHIRSTLDMVRWVCGSVQIYTIILLVMPSS
jgi:hypothetical protein